MDVTSGKHSDYRGLVTYTPVFYVHSDTALSSIGIQPSQPTERPSQAVRQSINSCSYILCLTYAINSVVDMFLHIMSDLGHNGERYLHVTRQCNGTVMNLLLGCR